MQIDVDVLRQLGELANLEVVELPFQDTNDKKVPICGVVSFWGSKGSECTLPEETWKFRRGKREERGG